ncbi:MAG TPA: SpoIIE family protein phosphatase [Thermoanaerobaculia bacterium]|nr:SpoIIE family protein phosphatase [Thermoanaerobaculia bacterium]
MTNPLDPFFVGCAAAFAFLHLTLFCFHREDRGNLYLSAAAAGFAAAIALPDGLLSLAAILAMILAFVRFAYWFTYERAPARLFALWLAAAPAALALAAFTQSALPFWAFVAASLIELLRTMRRGPVRRHPGDWLVAAGFGAIFLAAAAEMVIDLGRAFWAGIEIDIYPYGMLVLFAAMSIYLSWRFATTHRELAVRLREVEELSARTLEQERDARARELERRVLEVDHRRKTEELEGARRLQLSLLPAAPPDLPDVEVAFAMRTATEVGGDYYDYRSENGSLTLGVGDATGHGVDAGILVATVKGLFHTTHLEHGLRPAMERVHEGVAGLGLKRHHMSLALLRYSAGTVRFAAAGMPPLLVHRVATGEVEEILLEAPPLGVTYDRPYPEVRSQVQAGDTLLLTTDGLPERRNHLDELFGYEQLRTAFAACVGRGVAEIPECLFAAGDLWSDGSAQTDDMTVAVLRVRAQPPA